MTSSERKKARIARSKAKREAKRQKLAEEYGRIEKVITNQKLFRSLVKRRKGTDWKQSVQDYVGHFAVKNKRQKDFILKGGLPEPTKIRQIHLYERGKARRVHAVVIDSRVIQGAQCDSCITPLMAPSLISDNPASRQGKGVTYTRLHVERQLHDEFKKFGTEAVAAVFDFKGFFQSIRHDECQRTFERLCMDGPLIRLSMHFVKMYQVFDAASICDPGERKTALDRIQNNESIGVSLGSQISQNLALVIPNNLDHFIKDRLGIQGYIRYMDDGILTRLPKETLRKILPEVKRVSAGIGLKLHDTKTRIVKLTRGFVYLKTRYTMTDTGHLVKRMAHDSIVRMRRKMKKLCGLIRCGASTLDDAYVGFKSWMGNAKKYFHSYHARKNLKDLYYKMFKGYRLEGCMI